MKRIALYLVVVLGACCLPAHLDGQQITVKLVNAKSGKPVVDENVTVEWNFTSGKKELRTDSHGEGSVVLPTGTKAVSLMAGPKKGKESGRIPYTVCNQELMINLNVEQILAAGFVPGNTCKKSVAVVAKPGEIIFYIVPLPWYYIDMQ